MDKPQKGIGSGSRRGQGVYEFEDKGKHGRANNPSPVNVGVLRRLEEEKTYPPKRGTSIRPL